MAGMICLKELPARRGLPERSARLHRNKPRPVARRLWRLAGKLPIEPVVPLVNRGLVHYNRSEWVIGHAWNAGGIRRIHHIREELWKSL